MTESMPSSIQPNQAAQNPTICWRFSGVWVRMAGAPGAIVSAAL